MKETESIDKENAFRRWFNVRTAGMTRSQRQQEKINVANMLGITLYKINNWLLGYTIPNLLEQKAVNMIMKEQVF